VSADRDEGNPGSIPSVFTSVDAALSVSAGDPLTLADVTAAVERIKAAATPLRTIEARRCTVLIEGVEVPFVAYFDPYAPVPLSDSAAALPGKGPAFAGTITIVPCRRAGRASNLDPTYAKARRAARDHYPAITAVCRRPDRFRATRDGSVPASRRYLKSCLIQCRRLHAARYRDLAGRWIHLVGDL
jgi:hypothetical protein